MIIVGVGVGPGMLTQEAMEAISSASVIYGSRRSIEIAESFIKCEAHLIKDYKTLHLLPDDAVVLSTGDPMFSGLGKFATDKDRIITGISSIQAACARFHVEMSNMAMITAHGRDPEPAKQELVREIGLEKNIFMLPAATFGPKEVAEVLCEMGVAASICLYEDIAYPNERALCGSEQDPPENHSNMYCILVILNR